MACQSKERQVDNENDCKVCAVEVSLQRQSEEKLVRMQQNCSSADALL